MSPAALSPIRPARHSTRNGLDVADILFGAAWIAVCATGPEFVWRGARLANAHFDRSELLAALPLGLLLAFFVEPLLERLRHALIGRDHGHHPGRAPDLQDAAPVRRRGAAFHALTGLAFAFCAVCVHDAMKALATSHGGVHPASGAGTAPAIALTLGWALTPFAVTLAWRTDRRPVLSGAFCALATIAPVLAGTLFDWSRADMLDTAIPCVAILFDGLRRLRAGTPWPGAVLRSVGQVAGAWLLLALLLDLALDAVGLKRLALYSPGGFWMDVRFYAGWLAGLWLVPPHVAAATSGPATAQAEAISARMENSLSSAGSSLPCTCARSSSDRAG